MSLIRTQAIVLKSIKWGETSKIVSLYSRERGRIDVIAKGVRKAKKLHAGLFESLNLIDTVIYVSNKRDLQNIGDTTLINSFNTIRTDLDKTAFALAVLEIVNTCLPGAEADAIFFDFLTSQFAALGKTKNPLVVFWYFIIKISSYLGFKPHFNKCASCQKSKFEQSLQFRYSNGSIYCTDCHGSDQSGVQLSHRFCDYLTKLQNAHHQKVDQFPPPPSKDYSQFNFLLEYLRHHTEDRLDLESLRLLQK